MAQPVAPQFGPWAGDVSLADFMEQTFRRRCGDDPQQLEALNRVTAQYNTCQVYDVGDLLATHERDHLVTLGKAVEQAHVAGTLRSMLKFLGPAGTPHVPPPLPADLGGVRCLRLLTHCVCNAACCAHAAQTASQRLLSRAPHIFTHIRILRPMPSHAAPTAAAKTPAPRFGLPGAGRASNADNFAGAKRKSGIVASDVTEANIVPFVTNTIKKFAEGLTTQRPASKREFELNVVHPLAWWAINEFGVQPATNVINIYPRLGVLAVGMMGTGGMKKIVKGEMLDVGAMIKTRAGEFKRGGGKAQVMKVSAPEDVIKSPMQILINEGKVVRTSPVASNTRPREEGGASASARARNGGSGGTQEAGSDDDDDAAAAAAPLSRRAGLPSFRSGRPYFGNLHSDDDEDALFGGVGSSTRGPLPRMPSGAPSLGSRLRPSGSHSAGAEVETAGAEAYEDGSADEESPGAAPAQDASVTDAEASLELSKARVTASKPKISSLSSGDYVCVLRSEYPTAPVRDEECVGWATQVMAQSPPSLHTMCFGLCAPLPPRVHTLSYGLRVSRHTGVFSQSNPHPSLIQSRKQSRFSKPTPNP